MSSVTPVPSPTPLPPPPPRAAPAAPPAPAAIRWCYADDATALQRVGITIVRVVVYLLFISGFAMLFVSRIGIDTASTSPPSESFLRWTTWAYSVTEGTFLWGVEVALPPIGAVIALGLLAIGSLTPTTAGVYATARRRNGLSSRRSRSTNEEWLRGRGELNRNLRRLRGTKSAVLSSTRRIAWMLRAIGVLGALLMTWVAWSSLDTVIEDAGMTAGIGPTVALVGGLLTLAGSLMAAPWRRVRRFAFGPHGEVEVVRTTGDAAR